MMHAIDTTPYRQTQAPTARHKRRASADLARRWPDRKTPGKISPLYWRFVSLMNVVAVEHGGQLPDNDDGRDILRVMADAFWFGCREPVVELQRLIPRIAPWCDVDGLIDEVDERAQACPRPYTKHEAGLEAGITYAMQVRAKAWGITPCDKTDRQLAGLRRKRKAKASRDYRARQKAQREAVVKSTNAALVVRELMAKHGISRRTAYRWIAKGGECREPLTVSQPWKAMGISRRTWERRRRRDATLAQTAVTDQPADDKRGERQVTDEANLSQATPLPVTQKWHDPRHRQSVLKTNTSVPRGETCKRPRNDGARKATARINHHRPRGEWLPALAANKDALGFDSRITSARLMKLAPNVSLAKHFDPASCAHPHPRNPISTPEVRR